MGMDIRLLRPEEAEAYSELCLQLDRETPFRLYEVGERDGETAAYVADTRRFVQSPHSAIIVAADEETGALAGYLQAIGRPQRRIKHVVSINVAILQAYTGQGLGGRLFAFLEDWARQKGVKRLDLTVMQNNLPAQKLYRRLGFVEEGVKRGSICLNGAYIDEIYMSKWLG